MNGRTQISVILPVYNAKSCLRRAVKSVLAQSVKELELILVDDGSTDGSGALCDCLFAEDARVRVLHQPNGGVSAARNAGLLAARGEFLAFCDDDDEYLPGFLPKALAMLKSTNADVVRMDYRLFRERGNGTAELPHTAGTGRTLCRGDGGAAYDEWLRSVGPLFVWNAVYRRSAVGELRFDERCRFGLEDFCFNAAFHRRMEAAVYLPQPAYCHTERQAGASRAVSPRALDARAAALPFWLEEEYRAAQSWCSPGELRPVWNRRKAEGIAFLMHQLRDAHAPQVMQRRAWKTLRRALSDYPGGASDALRMAGGGKRRAALFLYTAHLEGLYPLLSKPEEL